MKLVKLVNATTEKVLNRLVGEATANAACPPDPYTKCIISGVCPGLHTKLSCRTPGNCGNDVCTYVGCC